MNNENFDPVIAAKMAGKPKFDLARRLGEWLAARLRIKSAHQRLAESEMNEQIRWRIVQGDGERDKQK